MREKIIYLKAQQNAEVIKPQVYVADIASLYCSDSDLCEKIKGIKVHSFKEKGRKREVIGILKVIELIEKECPGIAVENVGENATLIELVNVNKHKGPECFVKTLFVSAVSFFGTAFTIMAFHNDININKLFERIYEIVTGYVSDGYTILELSYSLGLAVGIIVFFNHIGGRRITKDPTPIEVEMRIYESDVNKALIETADREGKTIDVS